MWCLTVASCSVVARTSQMLTEGEPMVGGQWETGRGSWWVRHNCKPQPDSACHIWIQWQGTACSWFASTKLEARCCLGKLDQCPEWHKYGCKWSAEPSHALSGKCLSKGNSTHLFLYRVHYLLSKKTWIKIRHGNYIEPNCSEGAYLTYQIMVKDIAPTCAACKIPTGRSGCSVLELDQHVGFKFYSN